MCGIGLILSSEAPEAAEILSKYEEIVASWIGPRGDLPTSSGDIGAVRVNRELDGRLWLGASVLHIQGDSVAVQPRKDETGNVLLWNGEVFGFESMDGSIESWNGISDTVFVSNMLANMIHKYVSLSLEEFMVHITEFMASIHGPYAFIFFIPSRRVVLYGRDPFGRRSLTRTLSTEDNSSECFDLFLSSVAAPGAACEEVPIDSLFAYCIETKRTESFLWPSSRIKLSRKKKIPQLEGMNEHRFGNPTAAAPTFLELVTRSIVKRIASLAALQQVDCDTASTVGVLFSGGIDSVLLATILHRALPPHLAIDLINVSFYDPSYTTESPDRLAAIVAYYDLKISCPDRVWNMVHVDVSTAEKLEQEGRIMNLMKPCNTHMDLNIGTAFWFASRGRGYVRDYSEADVEVCLAQTSQKVPLLRIATASRATGANTNGTKTGSQLTGKELHALKQKCPTEGCKMMIKHGCRFSLCSKCCRKKLLSENVIESGCAVNQQEGCKVHDRKLRRYLNKDDNVGRHLDLEEKDPMETDKSSDIVEREIEDVIQRHPYVSRCKVLLVGIGADEQLGGYGRHRTAFRRGGGSTSVADGTASSIDASASTRSEEMTPLELELNKDLERLWKRNLGRDDRCASDHHRELWFPYLDEDVVRFVQSLEINEIVDMSLPQGHGDKMILREAARLAGISERCAHLVKRAIQFGTRVAKHTNLQCHGSNRKGKGDFIYEKNDEDDC